MSPEGVAAGCKGWVVSMDLLTKSNTEDSVLTQLQPNSGHILFQSNPDSNRKSNVFDGWVTV